MASTVRLNGLFSLLSCHVLSCRDPALPDKRPFCPFRTLLQNALPAAVQALVPRLFPVLLPDSATHG